MTSRSRELIRVYKGRPVWIKYEDWWHCISIHDTYFFTIRTYYKKLLIQHRSRKDLRIIIYLYKQFIKEEREYYRQYGLSIPNEKSLRNIRNEVKSNKVICKVCGKLFTPWSVKKAKTCSYACRNVLSKQG